jgi:cytosine/adenosine deaminase-related metal-dependent hydrolase
MSAIVRVKKIPITMHCAEVKADREFHESVSHTPASYCSELGLLGPRTVLVRVWATAYRTPKRDPLDFC